MDGIHPDPESRENNNVKYDAPKCQNTGPDVKRAGIGLRGTLVLYGIPMCDDPRKPHRLRFDSRREEHKMRRKSELILDMCQPGKQHRSTRKQRLLSPPTGHTGSINMLLNTGH